MKQLFVSSLTLCPPPSSKAERLDAKSRKVLIDFARKNYPKYLPLMERAEFYRVSVEPQFKNFVEFLDGQKETLQLFMSLQAWEQLFPKT